MADKTSFASSWFYLFTPLPPTSHFFEKGRLNHLHLLGNCFCYLMENPTSQRMENGLCKWLQIAMIPFWGQMPRIVTESNILSHRTFLLLCSCIFSKMYHYVYMFCSVATKCRTWDRFRSLAIPIFLPWPLPYQATLLTWNFPSYFLLLKHLWNTL